MSGLRFVKLFCLILVFSLVSKSQQKMAQPTEIPEKFFGTFKLERSENFDEFLAAKGVNWFVRKMIQLSSITKIFAKSAEQENTYDMTNLTSKKNTYYKNFRLGETFEAEGLDSEMHRITFNFDRSCDCIKETHIRTDEPDDNGETYEYTIDNNDMLVLKMSNNDIICKRFFKRQ